jgi:hypothetical protein
MSVGVRSVLAFFGIYVLAVLLASTFPVGAGDAAHGGALLHPVFPHVHLGHAEADRGKVGLTPAIDASAGGATEALSSGLTPPLPRAMLGILVGPEQRLIIWDLPRPIRLLEPPPDPPPTSLVSY